MLRWCPPSIMLTVLNSSGADFRNARLMARASGSPMDPVEDLLRTDRGTWLLRSYQSWAPGEASLSVLRVVEVCAWLIRNGFDADGLEVPAG